MGGREGREGREAEAEGGGAKAFGWPWCHPTGGLQAISVSIARPYLHPTAL